jgi:hypothetical protein
MTYDQLGAGKVVCGKSVIRVLFVDMFQQIGKVFVASCTMTGTALLSFDHGM